MRHRFYESKLVQNLTQFPRELCFMLSEADLKASPGRLAETVGWLNEFPEIGKIIFHISTPNPDTVEIETSTIPGTVRLVKGDIDSKTGTGSPETIIAVGKSGRQEICDAIRMMAVESIDPETIDESEIERHLFFKVTPDFVIKTGGNHLTDFLIWQSVYSELFFTDVNWQSFRKVDLLRALRDFQTRTRRFGR